MELYQVFVAVSPKSFFFVIDTGGGERISVALTTPSVI